ncbi:piggyBac transposable element-derived protein 4-like [Saccostrea cucullata]|uniref:piggyBac transposable element-derived protein 4-like n=1 Tax=Saccostrea cuccullata TaxID=36930 RepID=UPI002ED13581
MEGYSSDDDSDTLSEGSDLQLFSDYEFSSDTDSDNDTQQTESSIEADSQQTEAGEDDFWSYDLHPVDVAPFTEPVGPEHNLLPDDDLIKYFYLMINEEFFEIAARETNRYAEQEMTRKGSRDSVWYATTGVEMKAFFGMTIIMGINQVPRIDMYWSENPFVGNAGFKTCMTRTRFEKLLQYLHINDNDAQAPAGSPNFDRFHKIRPLINMTRENFKKVYKPGKCQSIDEGMIRYKGHHYAQQYTPGKPIKRGLKIWMRCEPSGYTNDYRVYLGKHDSMCGPSLGERVVKHLCKPLKWKGHHVFFDRYFTSIPLLQTLESYGIYGCGTIMSNRKGFPLQLRNPHLPERGDAEQMQHNNLVATVWNDAKPVHIVSTTSDPLGDGPAQRKVRGGGVIVIQRPPAVELYQENYYGVDRTQQYRSKCPVGRPSKKFWKYLVNFIFEISLINTFLLWLETPDTKKPTKHFSMIDSNLAIAEKLIGDFSSRKRAPSTERGFPCISVASIDRHISTKLTRPRGKCKQCTQNGRRSDTFFGCSICNVHLCRGACFQAFHANHNLLA